MANTLYHVAPKAYRRGEDLLPLAKRFPVFTAAVGARIVRKWSDLASTADPLAAAAEYYYSDGQEVHLYESLDEAISHRELYARSGKILAVDVEGLDVRQGREFAHPVVLGSISGDRVRRA